MEKEIRQFLKSFEQKCKSGYRVQKTHRGRGINRTISHDNPILIHSNKNGFRVKVNNNIVYEVKHQQQFNAKEAYKSLGVF